MKLIGYDIDHGGLEFDEILRLSKLGEELGYDSISFYDHLYSLSGEKELCLETWSMLPAISVNTKRVKLLPLVTNNLFRHPRVLAKMAATVDSLSHGRLIFGIGAGWYEKEALDFGYKFPNFKTRLEMLGESIQIISKLWQEDRTTFQGKHYKLEDAESLPKPVQKPHPPILIGGRAKGILRLAAKYGDMCNITTRAGVEGTANLLQLLRDYCSKYGRDYNSITKTIEGTCFFATSESELQRELEDVAKRRNISVQELVGIYKSSSLFGTTDQVIDQIRAYEKLGIEGVIFRFNKPIQDKKAKQFAEEILPKVRS